MTSNSPHLAAIADRFPRAQRLAPGLGLSVVLLATIAAYWPSRYGEIIWDDDVNLLNRAVCTSGGLYRIWFEPGATEQYYPVLYSAFWLEHKLWGDAVLGYHVVNVLCHSISVVLLYAILRRLQVAGAFLAAAIFALHPVMVESVAWMTEQRNTLSTVFYLLSMLVYLGFDESRRMSCYFAALGLFIVALLSKTVTTTLPVALLIIFWWQRGRLSWKRDVLPLVPFFAASLAAGVMTAWVEWTFVGASGAQFELSFVERFLIAGRALWFYLAKLMWPSNLIFVYPRWIVDPSQWWQWIYPLAALAVTAALWSLRKRWRSPLAAWLFYCATLFPVLGFLNMSYFLYSYVADHLQYLPSLGVFTFVAALTAQGIARLPRIAQGISFAAVLAFVAALALLSGRQSLTFANREGLYQTTIDRNPDCWMAYTNMAADDLFSGKIPEATAHLERSLQLNPENIAAWSNYGVALMSAGRLTESANALQRALAIKPDYQNALSNLGLVYAQMGHRDEAIDCFQRVLRRHPEFADARIGFAGFLYNLGRVPEAVEQFRLALQYQPNDLRARIDLARILCERGDLESAIPHLEVALELEPRRVDVHHALGEAYRATGRSRDAIEQYIAALRLNANFAPAYLGLAQALAAEQPAEAAATAEKGISVARASGQEAVALQLEALLKHYRKQTGRPDFLSPAR
jgi:protein O-mannosyl-transferase